MCRKENYSPRWSESESQFSFSNSDQETFPSPMVGQVQQSPRTCLEWNLMNKLEHNMFTLTEQSGHISWDSLPIFV